jgi:hypothetical protein
MYNDVLRASNSDFIMSVYRSLVFLVWGTLLIKCISCFMGLIIYATYYDCDPLETKVSNKSTA